MNQTDVAYSNGLRSRTEKVSTGRYCNPRRIGDLQNEGEVRTLEFEGCSASFGIVLENRNAGSPNRSRSTLGNIRIAKLLSDSPAGRDKSLRIGDRVLEINGHDLRKASLERARWYLGSALRSGKVTMTVMRDVNQRSDSPLANDGVIPSQTTENPAKLKNAVKKIHILKDSRGLGVQISLKVNRATGESGVFVSDVNPGGAAAKDGRLKEGDELLSINGHSLIGVTQQHAIDLLRASPKLIQMVISTRDEGSSVEGYRSLRGQFESRGNVYTKGIENNQMRRKVPRASSADNVLSRNKAPLDEMGKRHSIAGKQHRKYKNGSPKTGKQLLKNDNSKTADTERYNGHVDTKEQNDLLVKTNSANTEDTVTERRSSINFSENIVPSKLQSEDFLLSKAEESPDSEPAVLEGKPVRSPTASNTASSPDGTKKEHSMMPLPIESSGTGESDKMGRGLLSATLPRPESPSSPGIAFPARYNEDISSNITTVGLPTPNKIVGSNERDSPQVNRKGTVDVAPRKIRNVGEEVLTVVLVKGMNGKGLGFTIVGGKGSCIGDMPIYVKSILSGGTAEADGRLNRGDELLSINGTSLQGYTHQEALETFKNLRRGIVTLKVRRNSSETPNLSAFTTPKTSPGSSPRNSKDVTEDSSSNSSSPTVIRKIRQRRSKKQKNVEVVLFKEPGSSFGIGLGDSDPLGSLQQQGIFVQWIIEGSPAARDGRLRKGDQLLEVNDQKLADLSVEKVYEVLDRVAPGKTYIKVFQREMSERIPSGVSDALLKLRSERQLLDKKLVNKGIKSGPASTLPGASGSSDSCDNMSSLSSSSEPLIPPSTRQKKRHKACAVQKLEAVLPLHDPAVAKATEDIYTIIKQPTGELGMGVTIDKSRGSTKVEGVSVKSVNDGGAADRAKSNGGVGLRPGDHVIEVNGIHLKGMDQEDVIKIFRDLPNSTLMKIRRLQTDSVGEADSPLQSTVKENASVEKPLSSNQAEYIAQALPLVDRQRPLLRNRMQTSQGEKYSLLRGADFNKEKGFTCVQIDTFQKKKDLGNEMQAQGETIGHSQEQHLNNVDQPSLDYETTNQDSSERVGKGLDQHVHPRRDSQDGISIPNGFRKITVHIRKPTNSSLGLSLVPSHGKLKGYFQIRRLLSGMVCAQDGQLCVGDRIVSVNGLPLKGVTHSMALQLLKKPAELVTFVILREGVDTEENLSFNFSNKPNFGSLYEPSASSERRKQRLENDLSLNAEEFDCSVQSVENIESKLEEPQRDNTQDLLTGIGYSPPSTPVSDMDSLLDSHGFVPPPSFSPPPPPLLENSSLETKGDSTIPVVSPPPELSPRMKNFLTQDLFESDTFHGEREMDHNLRNDVIKQGLCESDNIPSGQTITMPDNQRSLTSSAIPNESGDSANQQSVDIHDSSGNLLIHSLIKENASDKKVRSEPLQKSVNSILLPVGNNGERSSVVGHDLSSATEENSLSSLTHTSQSEGDERYYKENKVENWTGPNCGDKDGNATSDESTELSDAMKPVVGRRVENVPFLIVYQKKFRSLGIKVDLSPEGKVVLTEVSSFGLVGKDGNMRVGDAILSLNDISLDGMHIEEVRNLIKNCPRGDVQIIAHARPKTIQLSEVEKNISLGQPMEHYDLHVTPVQVNNCAPEKMQFSNKDELQDLLLGTEFCTFQVGLPSKFVSQKISDVAGNTPIHLEIDKENHLPPLVATTNPSLIKDILVTKESNVDEKITDMYHINVNNIPPSTPPPPVPEENQVSKVESPLTSLDDTLLKNRIQDVSVHSLTPGDSMTVVHIHSFPDLNSEAEKIPLHDACLHRYNSSSTSHSTGMSIDHVIYQQIPLKSSFDLHEKQTYSSIICLESELQQLPPEEEQQTLPLKPPSLFGDGTETLPTVSLPNSTASVQRTWNAVDDKYGRQHSLLKPPSLFGDDTEGPSAAASLPVTNKNVLEEQIAQVNESPWDSEDKLSIKPPSLFADDLSGVAFFPVTSTSIEQKNHSKQEHTMQKGMLKFPSPAQVNVPIADKTTSELEIRQSSAYGFVNSVVATSSLDVPDDDSLPPAPPPPRKRVNRSSSWSIGSSFRKDPVSHGSGEHVHNNSHLQPAVKMEQKSSKRRMLPLRVRSKRGRKASEECKSEFEAEQYREGLSHTISVDGSVAVTSSGDAGKPLLSDTHAEPPEDDMESLPPAPPPPRVSPARTSPLTAGSGATNSPLLTHSPHKQVEIITSLFQPQDVQLSLESCNPTHPHPNRKSFRKTAVHADIEDLVHESSALDSSSVEVQITGGIKVDLSESHDPTTSPPLPAQMELWSEVGSAEAELAFLDQILTLEDSSKSGNEQSSEEGNLVLGKGGSSAKGALSINKIPRQFEENPLLPGCQSTYPAETLSYEKDSSEESSLVFSHNIGDGLPDSTVKASTSSKELNQDKESYSAIHLERQEGKVDLQDMPNTISVEGNTSEIAQAKNVVKQRRPAPPIPIRLPEAFKTASLPSKPVAANLISGAFPTAVPVDMKAATLPNQQKTALTPSSQHKEDECSLPAAKDTTNKKQAHKNQKGKKKHVDAQTISDQELSEGKSEQSRSWTKRLFGFRSRSKSSDKSNNKKKRTRSVSPPRGVLPKSKSSIVPPPLPSNKKPPLSEKSRESYEKNKKKQGAKGNQSPDNKIPLPKPLRSEPSPMKKRDKLLDDCCNKEQNNKLNSNLPDHHSAHSSFDSNALVEGSGVLLATDLVTQNNIYQKERGDVDYLNKATILTTDSREPCVMMGEANLATVDVNEIPSSDKPYPFPNHAKPLPTAQFAHYARKDENITEDNMHVNVAVKPPVPKKPRFLKAASMLASEQGNGLKDKEQKLDKALSLDSGRDTMSNFTDDTSRLHASYSDVSLPARGRIKPPPLVLEKELDENKINMDEIEDCPSSPGPPTFKPPPPPGVIIQKPNETVVCPPETSQAMTQECLAEASSQRFGRQRKMKPLPPIPNDFIPIAKEESEGEKESLVKPFNQIIPQLSRQYAQEQYDQSHENQASFEKENWLLEVSPAHSTSEGYDHAEVSELEQPSNIPLNVSDSDDFSCSEPSAEWEDCTSQENLGSSPVSSKLVKSASFSVGDYPLKPSPGEDNQQKPVPASISPPPLMRRRSSSLPGFPAEAEQGPEIANYWHTGNIQELINSRNKEPDVNEGIIEVQLLKEQQSIGLMVVGGLDTHLGMLYVKDIQPGSPAAKCGRLRTGDQLLQVNDHCLVGVNHGEALNILKNTPPLVKLTVARKQERVESPSLELAAEGRRMSELDGPIVSTAHESSTISKTSSELTLSPPRERAPRSKSAVMLSSFGTLVNDQQQHVPIYSSLDDPDEYIPAFLQPKSPTLILRQDDVPVTVIDGIPDEQGDAEEEEETRKLNKSVSWAITNDGGGNVFTVELRKGDHAGLGVSVSGGVDTACDNIMVRQILSSSVTAHDGRIKKGDILLSVNGKSFKGLTNAEALTLLKETHEHVTLVLYRPKGPRQGKRSAVHFKDKNNQGIHAESEAWPTKDEMTKKKNHANKRNTPPTLETIPLDITKQNDDNSMYERVKKRLFPNGGSKGLKERLHKAPQGPTVCEITLDKGASGLGFSLAGGQDSLYGDAPIQVKYVFKESVAGTSGALKPGDEILEVNGQRVSYMTHVDTLELIRKLPYGPVVMKIRRL